MIARRLALSIALAITPWLTVDLFAVSVPVGVEFQVNSFFTDIQGFSSVARETNGDFVVVWHSLGQDGASRGIFGKRFNSAGQTLGGEFKVNAITVFAQSYPAVTMDDDGDFVVVWESYVNNDQTEVKAQRYSSAGAAVGSEFQVNSYTTSDQWYPSLSMDSAGGFVVAWHSDLQDGSGDGVFGRRFTSNGVALGGEFQVNVVTASNQGFPAVAVRGNGDFAVTWTSVARDGNNDGVFVRRFTSAACRSRATCR